MDNRDLLIPALDIGTETFQPIALDPTILPSSWESVGLPIRSNMMNNCWSCPNRPAFPNYNAGFNQWGLGYMYYGGVTKWRNNLGTFNSASPVKTSTAKPSWMLAADFVIRFDAGAGMVWGDPSIIANSGFAYLPAHKTKAARPAGGNEVFIDGSARWVKAKEMYFLHSWSPGTRELYFYQDDLGMLEVARNSLSKIP